MPSKHEERGGRGFVAETGIEAGLRLIDRRTHGGLYRAVKPSPHVGGRTIRPCITHHAETDLTAEDVESAVGLRERVGVLESPA